MTKQDVDDEKRIFNKLIRRGIGEELIPDYFYKLVGLTKVGEKSRIKLLDVGCGRGVHSVNLAKLGFEVTGIDISPEAIKFAKRKAKETKIIVKFLLKDASNTGFPDENFDIVLFIGALHHFYYSGLEKVLVETKRILKKGGELILVEPNHLYPYNFLSYTIVHFFKKYKRPIFIKYIDEMFTINERSLNPDDLFPFLKKDFKLVAFKFFPYPIFLSQKADFESPQVLRKIRKIFDMVSLLLPENYRYDHFLLKLIKK